MITIYGTSTCKWCKEAATLAESRQLPYEYKLVDEDLNLYNEMLIKNPEAKSVPQIWWGDRYIGGYSSFANEVENTVGGYGDGKI